MTWSLPVLLLGLLWPTLFLVAGWRVWRPR